MCLPVRILEDMFTERMEKGNNKQACHQNKPFIPSSRAFILFYLLYSFPLLLLAYTLVL
jgi:hypothetical protein